MRRTLWILGALALVAVLVVGVVQAGDDDPQSASAPAFDLSAALQRLDQAPAPLAALHGEANQIVPSTGADFERRLKSLRGYPVVVNAWASWCGPCKLEFPIFQRVSTALGTQVAFVGLNVSDNLDDARGYLKKTPVPYPSLEDGDSRILQTAGGAGGLPTTIFYDKSGARAYIHQGGYKTEQDLREAIRRYAGA
jgi:thiol-disulfide isomerase/thioredoxin